MSDPMHNASMSVKSSTPVPKKKNRNLNMFLLVVVLILIGLFVWSEKGRRDTAHQLETAAQQLEAIKNSSQESGEARANEVIEKVHALIDIPTDPRPTVAQINDIDRLREANAFFGNSKNGDYLVLTGNRAIIYDPDRDIVVDVAPFQVNRTSVSPSPSATPSAEVSQ